MPEVRLELPESVHEALVTECDLMGFDGPQEYLAWLVEHRGAVRPEGEERRVLAAYAERVRELEARLAGPDGDGTPGGSTDGRIEANLAPSTVRLEDDAVAELADELAGVQDHRMDEVVRRAVAKTRRRLGEGTETGVDYRSSAALREAGPRPGAEITDLDELAVPGYDEDLVERRRTAVGAALAFLRDEKRARRSEFVDALYGEYPAGYESADGWWNCVKRGLRQVDRVDGADEGSRTWRYRDYRGRVRVLRD